MCEELPERLDVCLVGEIQHEHGWRLWLEFATFVVNTPGVKPDTAKGCREPCAAGADLDAEGQRGSEDNALAAGRP